MLSSFHKTIAEPWRKTPSTQKGSPFSLKEGRTKQKTKRDTKELGTETGPGEGVVMEEKFPNSRKPSLRWVCGEFRNFSGQHKQEKKKNTKPTEYSPKHNCQ